MFTRRCKKASDVAFSRQSILEEKTCNYFGEGSGAAPAQIEDTNQANSLNR